jgi:hypothetical protein
MAGKMTKSVQSLLLDTEQQPTVQEPSSTVMQKANTELVTAEARRKQLLKTYREEPKVPMYLSPMYRPYFGNVMTVSMNGISIFFKVDGSIQQVPQTFADEITARRMAIDAILNKQHRMADIANNVEKTPGELALF